MAVLSLDDRSCRELAQVVTSGFKVEWSWHAQDALPENSEAKQDSAQVQAVAEQQ